MIPDLGIYLSNIQIYLKNEISIECYLSAFLLFAYLYSLIVYAH